MKSIVIVICLVLCIQFSHAQNVGIGTANPDPSAQLDISSTAKGLLIPRLTTVQRTAIASPATGLMVYDTDLAGFWFYDGSVWASVNNAASNEWVSSSNDIYNLNTGRVGIGTSTPVAKLNIYDPSYGASLYQNFYTGTNSSDGLYVGNSASADAYFWNFETASLFFGTSNIRRLTILSNGNVGIGTSSPAYALDVVGAIKASGNIQSLGDANIDGTLVVNNGKGVAYNLKSSTNLKIAQFTTGNFHAVLGAFGSAETTIGLPAGFTSTPSVFVGNIHTTGGTVGELNRVILVLWNCTTTACTAKIINTDNTSVDYNITWDCLAVGN